jgi:hypothetical protein
VPQRYLLPFFERLPATSIIIRTGEIRDCQAVGRGEL